MYLLLIIPSEGFLLLMFSLVRKVVAGPKNTTNFEGTELDLTYITSRIIAMAYPASHLIEKTYRNKIEDVVDYFNQKHQDSYLIINVSSRVYDYTLFDNRVKDYQWADHQSPPLTTLVEVAYEMYKYLKGMGKEDMEKRVVAVHCNHGKGRTGTTIISFLLLAKHSESALDCLKFYNSKRFNKQTYGVDRPCQIRYLSYIERLIKSPKINQKLVCYRLKSISHKGLNCDYYMKIQFTRNESTLFEKVDFGVHVEQPIILLSDILIEIYLNTWTFPKKIAKINTNLYFCDQSLKVTFYGKDLKLCDNSHHSDFSVTLHLQYFCLCHLPTYEETVCKCKYERTIEEKYWQKMVAMIKECKKITPKETAELLYGRQSRVKSSFKSRGKRDQMPRSLSSRKAIINDKFKFPQVSTKPVSKNTLTTLQPFSPSTSTQKRPQKTRQLNDQIQYYNDGSPIIKISKVQKIQ